MDACESQYIPTCVYIFQILKVCAENCYGYTPDKVIHLSPVIQYQTQKIKQNKPWEVYPYHLLYSDTFCVRLASNVPCRTFCILHSSADQSCLPCCVSGWGHHRQHRETCQTCEDLHCLTSYPHHEGWSHQQAGVVLKKRWFHNTQFYIQSSQVVWNQYYSKVRELISCSYLHCPLRLLTSRARATSHHDGVYTMSLSLMCGFA